MSYAAELLTGLVLFVVAWLGHEVVRHRRALRRIPVRVHVNGTRGKSSVTRLIAAGLRAGDKRVVAKTTGTLARVILPGERELAVFRPLGANVREQIRIVRFDYATGESPSHPMGGSRMPPVPGLPCVCLYASFYLKKL